MRKLEEREVATFSFLISNFLFLIPYYFFVYFFYKAFIMKKPDLTFLTLFLAILLCFFARCKKNETSKPTKTDSSNIILRDKPLSVIQSYIKGNWQLQYEQGGITGGRFPHTNFFWEFSSSDRVKVTYQSNVVTDTLINWVRTKDVFTDSTFLMTFSDKLGYPYVYIVDGIYNDTLVLYDNASDYITYHFTKTN
jgi:hypothetical protein